MVLHKCSVLSVPYTCVIFVGLPLLSSDGDVVFDKLTKLNLCSLARGPQSCNAAPSRLLALGPGTGSAWSLMVILLLFMLI